jgi:hypothetical protein
MLSIQSSCQTVLRPPSAGLKRPQHEADFLSPSDGFGGLVVSMLASVTEGRGFKPGRSPSIFMDEKTSLSSSGGEVKESVPCPSFAACKRT